MIFNEAVRGEAIAEPENTPRAKVKFVNEDTPASIDILGDQVLIAPTSQIPLLIHIDNKMIADSFKVQFENLWRQDVYTLTTPKMIADAFDKVIEEMPTGGEIVVYGARRDPRFVSVLKRHHEKRVAKSISAKLLVTAESKSRIKDLYRKEARAQIKFHSYDFNPLFEVGVYGDNVLMVSWEKKPVGFLIKNKQAAQSHKKYFDLLWNQEVRVYKGFKEVTTKFRSMLDEIEPYEEYLALGATWGDIPKLKKWFWSFHKERVKLKRKVKLLSVPKAYDLIVRELTETGDPEMKLGAVKKLPSSFSSPVQVNLYKNNKVLMFLWNEMTCIEIESKELYNNFRTYFDALWNQDTSMDKGIDALNNALNSYLDSLELDESFNVQGATFGRGDSSYRQKQYLDAFKNIHQKRADGKIKARLLFQQRDEATINKFRKTVYNKYHEAKVLPYKTEFPVAILPSRNKTVIIIHKDEPSIITINNKEASQAFLKHFESLWDQDVSVYKGFKEVTDKFTSLMESQNPGEEYYVLGGTYGSGGKKLKDWFMKYTIQRIKRGVPLKLLSVPKDYEQIIYEFTHTGDPNMKFSKAKRVPPSFASPMQINLYKNNKVVMFLWNEMTCFEIESKDLYENFKTYFDALWDQDTTVSKGFDNLYRVFKNMIDELKPGEEFTVLGAAYGAGVKSSEYQECFKKIHEYRNKKGVKARLLFYPDAKAAVNKNKDFYKNAEYKFLPYEVSSPVGTNVYRDKTILIVQEESPTIIEIDNKNIALTYKAHFESIWNSIEAKRKT
jgi:hypothetical protein